MRTHVAMALWLHFADSEVAFVAPTGDGVRIRLSAAYVLREEGGVGKPTEGFARGVELLLAGAGLSGAVGELMGRISQGRVRIGGRWFSQMALPSSSSGTVTLELTFANHAELVLSASRIECRYESEPNFSESLLC